MVEQPMWQQRVGQYCRRGAEVGLEPVRHTAFTVLWIATVVANVGSWMYNAASGWPMTTE
jgi:hypothetical protein